jgi:hypothetical protein
VDAVAYSLSNANLASSILTNSPRLTYEEFDAPLNTYGMSDQPIVAVAAPPMPPMPPVPTATAVPVQVAVVAEAVIDVPDVQSSSQQTLPSQHHRQNQHLQSQSRESHLMNRKRKPDPNNELTVALGSIAYAKNKKIASAGSKHRGGKSSGPQARACSEDDNITHTNELIRQDLEVKAYQLIREHAASRRADRHEMMDAQVPVTSTTLPSDEDALKYFPNMVEAFNQGSVPDLKIVFDSMLASNCVYRTHVIRIPGRADTRFTDKVVHRAGLLGFYQGILDSYPDAFYKVECNKILSSKDGSVKTVAGYFNFKGTDIVYHCWIEAFDDVCIQLLY